MNALLTGLIGVGATLLGSFSTYLFQSRTTERAQAFERDERLRQEQLNSCSAFASAISQLKRGLITLWFQGQRDRGGADYQAVRIECDQLGASAEAARFRVELVSGDPTLVTLADAAFTAAGAIGTASDRGELRGYETRFEAAVKVFIRAASARVRMTPASSAQVTVSEGSGQDPHPPLSWTAPSPARMARDEGSQCDERDDRSVIRRRVRRPYRINTSDAANAITLRGRVTGIRRASTRRYGVHRSAGAVLWMAHRTGHSGRPRCWLVPPPLRVWARLASVVRVAA